MKKYKIGMYGGSFNPLHNGHIKCILKALDLCDEVHLIIGDIPNMDDVDIHTKLQWFQSVFKEFNDRLVFHTLYDDRNLKSEYTLDKWLRDSNTIKAMVGKPIDAVFCGSDYEEKEMNPYKICYPEQTIIYLDRYEDQISSSEFKKNIYLHKNWVPEVVFEYYLKLKTQLSS